METKYLLFYPISSKIILFLHNSKKPHKIIDIYKECTKDDASPHPYHPYYGQGSYGSFSKNVRLLEKSRIVDTERSGRERLVSLTRNGSSIAVNLKEILDIIQKAGEKC